MLFDRIKGALEEEKGEGPQYRYQCRECGADFETGEAVLSKIDCPDCGASGTRALTRL